MSFVNEIALHKNRQRPFDVIYTDFKSAFETVPQDLLVSVLTGKGVGPRITRWISDFVDGRSFQVKVNGYLKSR